MYSAIPLILPERLIRFNRAQSSMLKLTVSLIAYNVLGFQPKDPYNLDCMKITKRPENRSLEQHGVEFNPDLHFALENPKQVMDLNF